MLSLRLKSYYTLSLILVVYFLLFYHVSKYYSLTCVVILSVIYHLACLFLVIYNSSQSFILHSDHLHWSLIVEPFLFCTRSLHLSNLRLSINQRFLLKKSAAEQSTHDERILTHWRHFGEHMVSARSPLCCCSHPRCCRGRAQRRKAWWPGWRQEAAAWVAWVWRPWWPHHEAWLVGGGTEMPSMATIWAALVPTALEDNHGGGRHNGLGGVGE
jgi:hypothetical protein